MVIGTTFPIIISYSPGVIRLKAKKVAEDQAFEHFEVKAKNKTLVLRSNRPLLKRLGLKHKRTRWELITGTLSNISVLEAIFSSIDKEIRRRDDELKQENLRI